MKYSLSFHQSQNYLRFNNLPGFGANLSNGVWMDFDIKTKLTSPGLYGQSETNKTTFALGLNRTTASGNSSGLISLRVRGTSATVCSWQTAPNTGFNDGEAHNIGVIVHPAAQRRIDFYIDGTVSAGSVVENGTIAQSADFTYPFAMGGMNIEGTGVTAYFQSQVGNIRFGRGTVIGGSIISQYNLIEGTGVTTADYVGTNVGTLTATPGPNLPFWAVGLGTDTYPMWGGMGIQLNSQTDNSVGSAWIDDIVASGFKTVRCVPNWGNGTWVAASKVQMIYAYRKGLKTLWGIGGDSSGTFTGTSGEINTGSAFNDFANQVMIAGTWANVNGVHEFLIGNEEEEHVYGTFTSGQMAGSMNVLSGSVQGSYTAGNVSYYTTPTSLTFWGTAFSAGSLDYLACNVYSNGVSGTLPWNTTINTGVTSLGTAFYVGEFGPDTEALGSFSADETVQANKVKEMIDHIRSKGVSRAIYFCYEGSQYGAKNGGTARQIWYNLLNSSFNDRIRESSSFSAVRGKKSLSRLN